MIVDKAKLKELAEGMKGWDKMTECWPCDENGPDWQVGQLDEEENRYPVMTIDTEQYDCEADAPKVAQYYAAANPAAVLALLAEIERLEGLRADAPPRPPEGAGLPRYGLRWNGPTSPVSVPREDGYWTPWHLAAELLKDAERYRFLRSDLTMGGDVDFCIVRKHWKAPALERILSLTDADEQIDVAISRMKKTGD